MEIIRQPLAEFIPGEREVIRVRADRLVLAKRRWRGIAEDGREFGFDLSVPLADGDAVWQSGSALYVLAQKYEPVLEIALGSDAVSAARLGWVIGNLHFAIEVAGEVARVADDHAMRQLFAREEIAFTACKRVFRPLSGAHGHSH